MPYSNIQFELLPGRVFASVRESVINWEQQASDPAKHEGETRPHRQYEGIALHPNGALFVLMRNVLTGTPRIYWLGQATGGRLLGYGHESISSLDSLPTVGSPLRSSTDIILDPVREDEQ